MNRSILLIVGLSACAAESDPDPAGAPVADVAVDTAPDAAAPDASVDGAGSDALDATAGCGVVPPAVTVTARLTVDPETGVLRDTLGREVVMRGINAGGRSKWAPFVPFPVKDDIELPAFRKEADAFFGRIPAWGLDTVRLTLSWEALEPTDGTFDYTYLGRYEAMVDSAWNHGLRVVVDFHQDVFASPFCGDGFPLWTIPVPDPGPPRHDCESWFEGYMTGEDVKASFDALWDESSGLQTRMRGMWKTVAQRLAEHPAVVGFEIINEPGWGSAKDIDVWRRDVLTPFHERMAKHLSGLAPNVLVFYDATGVDAVVSDPQRDRPDGEGLVFAPHLYDFGLLSGGGFSGLQPEPPIANLAKWRDAEKTPVLLGEFAVGGDPSDAGADWLDRLMDAVDEHRHSATLWEYSVSPELWNGEDLSVTDASGAERTVLDTYVRPWLRAVAGTGASFSWDREAGLATARWTSDGGTTEIVAPPRLFPDGPQALEVKGDSACHTWDPERGELRVTAPAGVEVEVTFTK